MSYYILVYNMSDGSEVPEDFEVELPDDIDEDDIEAYIDEHYPQVGEYQVEPN
jgi:pyruvate formate-lyase activating enzyme-like uncharacterized protein